ncbi:MAG: cytochrome c family protein [Fibrobacteria bacterium]|nr:cytochrome c family protein [Fibrobacteria bacterium]
MPAKTLISSLLLATGLVVAGEEAASTKPGFKKFDLADGKKVYEANCASCHGASGKGDGAAAAALNPKPRNLCDSKYMSQRSWEDLRKVIAEGGANTGFSALMPGWKGVLKKPQIDNVLAYVLTFSGNSAKADQAAAKAAEKAAPKKAKAE